MRTNVPHILASGDIVGQPMLAHKASLAWRRRLLTAVARMCRRGGSELLANERCRYANKKPDRQTGRAFVLASVLVSIKVSGNYSRQ
jgi:hypothetical protein